MAFVVLFGIWVVLPKKLMSKEWGRRGRNIKQAVALGARGLARWPLGIVGQRSHRRIEVCRLRNWSGSAMTGGSRSST